MRFKILFVIVSVAVLSLGVILYSLNNGVGAQFQQTFNSYGVAPPLITEILLSTWSYWWLYSIGIAVVCYLPLFILKGKKQYFSVAAIILCAVLLMVSLYASMFTTGSIV